MSVELIPVIEIGYNNQGVQAPDKYPYWNHPDLWDKYHDESYQKAGFRDRFTPYLPGSSFYRLTDISDDNLKKLVQDHTEEIKEQSCAFFGGYVLRMDGLDMLFPQCCGLLSDIEFWTKVSNRQDAWYEGHPAPALTFMENSVVFDLDPDKSLEIFQPEPPVQVFEVDLAALRAAVEKVKDELVAFGERLKKINATDNLNIMNIDKVLIWSEEDSTPENTQ